MKSFSFWTNENTERSFFIELSLGAGTKVGRLYITPNGGAETLVTDGVPSVTSSGANVVIPANLITTSNFPASFRLQISTDGGAYVDVATGKGYIRTYNQSTPSHSHTNKVILDAVTAAFTIEDETKLDGIDTGATANATNAELRDRSTHTGTQTSTTISDLTEAVQDIVAAFLTQGTGITLSYDDSGNSLSITATGGGGGLDAEGVRDTVGAALNGSGLVSVVVNDAADTITISTTATQNSTDAALRDRSTHTGTQSADTLTDGSTNRVYLTAEKTKLAGIASGATANDTDANLKNRANHTGTQPVSSITGLAAIATSGSASDITGGTLPTSVIPAIAIVDVFVVNSQAEMLALSAEKGDVAVRTDTPKSFILSSNSPGTLADWTELPAIGSVQSVNGQQGVVVLGKGDVGLANVDNTSDANKPVSTAQQSALDAKAPINNPTFTGTVSGVTKTHVGLSNVDNTSDSSKPVSTAQQAALDAKEALLQTINPQTGTSYTVVSGDLGKMVTRNNAGASTHTIPTGLPTGHRHHIFNRGAGIVTIGGSGITFEPSSTLKLVQYAGATVVHLGSEIYAVVGKLSS